MHISPTLDSIERAYDDAKYGQPSREPVLEITMPTSVDRTIAPKGKHILSIFVQYAPYQLADGATWDEINLQAKLWTVPAEHTKREKQHRVPLSEPAIQLLEYDEGEAAGGWSVRFCFYNRDGRFQRSPLLVDEENLDGLRTALAETPRLRALLRRLVQED